MTFVTNAKPPLPMEAGTVFRLKSDPSITIHHYIGCGESWYLSCPSLGFDTEDLRTECFDEAVANAQTRIAYRLSSLINRFNPIVADHTEITLTRI